MGKKAAGDAERASTVETLRAGAEKRLGMGMPGAGAADPPTSAPHVEAQEAAAPAAGAYGRAGIPPAPALF